MPQKSAIGTLGNINESIDVETAGKNPFRLSRLGNPTKGETKALAFTGFEKIKNLFTILRFNVEFPDKTNCTFNVIHSKPAVVITTTINNKYVVMTRQYRFVFQKWMTEFVRGWVQSEHNFLEVIDHKIPQLQEIATEETITSLFEGPEDTGIRDNKLTHLWANFSVDIEEIKNQITVEEIKKWKESFNSQGRKTPKLEKKHIIQIYLRKTKRKNGSTPLVTTIQEMDDALFNIQNGIVFEGVAPLDHFSAASWALFYFHRHFNKQ